MAYYVEQAVRDLGVKIVFAEVEGFDNQTDDPAWDAQREERLSELVAYWTGKDLHADPVLEGFHILHDHAHVRRKHNVPAPVTLIKLLVKRGNAPYINKVVDIYNTISMETRLALGAHDLDRVEGDVTLRITDGSELYVPLGEYLPVPPAARVFVLRRLQRGALPPRRPPGEQDRDHAQDHKGLFYRAGQRGDARQLRGGSRPALGRGITHYAGGSGRVVIPQTK